MFIEPELASSIVPSEVRPGLSLASVTGELEVKDNVYTIKVNINTYRVKINMRFMVRINIATCSFIEDIFIVKETHWRKKYYLFMYNISFLNM